MLVLEKVFIGTIGYRDQYIKKKIDTFMYNEFFFFFL